MGGIHGTFGLRLMIDGAFRYGHTGCVFVCVCVCVCVLACGMKFYFEGLRNHSCVHVCLHDKLNYPNLSLYWDIILSAKLERR